MRRTGVSSSFCDEQHDNRLNYSVLYNPAIHHQVLMPTIRYVAKLDNVQAALTSLVLRNERLRSVEAQRQFRLRLPRSFAGFHEQLTEFLIRSVIHHVWSLGGSLKPIIG